MALNASDLLGVWRLAQYVVPMPDGRIVHPFGPDADGLLIYTPDGWMSAALGRRDRAPFPADHLGAGSVGEKARAAETFLAYAGRWEVKGDAVVHHVALSLFPNWTGGDQLRLASFEAGNLVLSTPPVPRPKGLLSARLTWRRV